ncbi:MAG: NADH-quinone oxidoreductase subunit H [Bdellovibrionales bacterium]|nr:NADH-quinone oxidoreductase subunit H [Bdellovibrionales bacterium]
MSWREIWIHVLGLSPSAPEWLVAALVLVMVFVFAIFPFAALMSLLDRKLSADLQARVGPNRAGRWGVLQPLADLIKLLQKEPTEAMGWREGFWLGVLTLALYSTAAVLPLGSALVLVDTDSSALVVFWAVAVVAVCLMFLGYNQDTVPGWFSGTRLAAQALSGAFPSLLAVVCAGLWAGGFEWSRIVQSQGASPGAWAMVRNPFLLLAFAVFMGGGQVILSVPPLGSGYSISDIKGGVASGFHGRKIAFFRLGRFYGLFLWCIVATTCFCGGWNLPGFVEGLYGADKDGVVAQKLIEPVLAMSKASVLMICTTLFGKIMPTLRSDQVTDFAWRVLSPLALIALIGTAIWMLGVPG